MLGVGLMHIVKPLFCGAKLGLDEKGRGALEDLGQELEFTLVYSAPQATNSEETRDSAAEARDADLDS